MQSAVFIITVLTVTLAAVVDIYRRRIPNGITVPAFAMGLLIHFLQAGWVGVLDALAGFFIGFSIFFLLWLLGGKGAGDVKLMGAVGALLGYQQLMTAFLLIALIGAAMALVYIVKRRAWGQTLGNLAQFPAFVMERVAGKSLDPTHHALTLQSPTAIKFPYGVPIAVGTILSFFVLK